ncbi:hypothetical protein FOTG_19159 [Fusarium oxysporum f. sp. vasinfectum 25433]|uniref:Uncharacterized protein n=1 Tax=Fusarium oxysporum f. sp. vasinfectum 25433 TaxID=1089449 RepID=X0KUK5_FUSOX|nr:hypothetical protein FOTG_19159 [Fusarium oxysporum f. sp. vasinfectum 25433]
MRRVAILPQRLLLRKGCVGQTTFLPQTQGKHLNWKEPSRFSLTSSDTWEATLMN